MNIESSAPLFSSAHARASRTAGDMVGLACLLGSLLLMSTGVQTVKADDEALMSVDPERIEAERQKAAAKNRINAVEGTLPNAPTGADALKAGVPAIEVQPGVVVLNTRGFNYGPPPAAIDPAAMGVEKGPKPSR